MPPETGAPQLNLPDLSYDEDLCLALKPLSRGEEKIVQKRPVSLGDLSQDTTFVLAGEPYEGAFELCKFRKGGKAIPILVRSWAITRWQTERLTSSRAALPVGTVISLENLPEGQPLIIGRGADVDIKVDSPEISRRHAKIWRQGDRWFIEDLGSTHGTFINEWQTSKTPKEREEWRYGEWRSATATDIGQVRDLDEDSVLAIDIPAKKGEVGKKGTPRRGFYVVADGMGGHQKGEEASRMVTEHLGAAYRAIQDSEVRRTDPRAGWLQDKVRAVHQAVRTQLPHSGSTVVAAWTEENRVFFANVGDSRGYVVSPRGIEQVTEDHSLAASLAKLGMEAGGQNVLYRAIGSETSPEVDVFARTLTDDEWLLLCCDGLWGMLSDSQIQAIVAVSSTPDVACQRLVAAANAAGGEDNITVAIYGRERLAKGAPKTELSRPEAAKVAKPRPESVAPRAEVVSPFSQTLFSYLRLRHAQGEADPSQALHAGDLYLLEAMLRFSPNAKLAAFVEKEKGKERGKRVAAETFHGLRAQALGNFLTFMETQPPQLRTPDFFRALHTFLTEGFDPKLFPEAAAMARELEGRVGGENKE